MGLGDPTLNLSITDFERHSSLGMGNPTRTKVVCDSLFRRVNIFLDSTIIIQSAYR